ncbi:L-aspartate oxidase [Bacillus taeanensis]|uniref:L-aspartate oxidase n=1 Tax=Bacillus taeanensis TaxID=273032 RepID=A0A366Y5X3_9BACI|nr:L-aspartate oxidase [Bacillus taeanensis]RBW71611.1 L-aspartate oxidase [Bacillus taeanensis]
MKVRQSDVLIIGSGIAGLMVAELLSSHKNVTIITKSKWKHSNSRLAQGGIAAAVTKEDHWLDHFFDTLAAGDEHNSEEMTRLLVKEGLEMVKHLIQIGVPFDRNESGELILAQEGAHRIRRILHAGGDATGHAIVSTLFERVSKHTTIIEEEMVVDLIVENECCQGAWTINSAGEKTFYSSPSVVLAAGGAGGLYPVTSNDASVTGDGFAIAYRAGAKLADLEFVQFHPTMLVCNGQAQGLISEAVRGEGAVLVTESGERLMIGVHEQEDLAPRDVVSRAIFHKIQEGEQVYLDIKDVSNFHERFPTISEMCKKNGIDLQKGLLPVMPGAHFNMGGVSTDQKGRTTLSNLYAVGEVAHTGVHGANRLASNSLLEGIVFAKQAANAILTNGNSRSSSTVPSFAALKSNHYPSKKEIQKVMEKYVGIIRTKQGLQPAVQWFESYLKRISARSIYEEVSIDDVTKLNMLTSGWLIASAALRRTESRGGHYRSDYPLKDQLRWHQQTIYFQKDNQFSHNELVNVR